MPTCRSNARDNAGRCAIVRCARCGYTGCSNPECRNAAFAARCLSCQAIDSVQLGGRWTSRVGRSPFTLTKHETPDPMTQSLKPKYVGLLLWVLAIGGAGMLPAGIRQAALYCAVLGFIAWFVHESQRGPRALRRHLREMAGERRRHRPPPAPSSIGSGA